MDTPRALKWTIFLGAAASVVYLCLRILSPFFNVLAWASVLAITFYPVHVYLLRRGSLQRAFLAGPGVDRQRRGPAPMAGSHHVWAWMRQPLSHGSASMPTS